MSGRLNPGDVTSPRWAGGAPSLEDLRMSPEERTMLTAGRASRDAEVAALVAVVDDSSARTYEELEAEHGAALKALAESRANTGDLEARLVEAEAVIQRVRVARGNHPACDIHFGGDPVKCGWKRAVQDIDTALDSARPVVLADHDKEVAARALDAFAAELRERYPEDVFRPLSDSDHMSVNDALAGRVERTHITRDAVSADMMRFAAEQATDYATDIRSGSEGDNR